IEEEWRLFEVMAVDGVRRSPPLARGEASERREFIQGTPSKRGGGRGGGGGGVAVVALVVVVAILANPFGEASSSADPSQEERALRALVPEGIRDSGTATTSTPPDAIAGLECRPDESYTVSYARFDTPDDMR